MNFLDRRLLSQAFVPRLGRIILVDNLVKRIVVEWLRVLVEPRLDLWRRESIVLLLISGCPHSLVWSVLLQGRVESVGESLGALSVVVVLTQIWRFHSRCWAAQMPGFVSILFLVGLILVCLDHVQPEDIGRHALTSALGSLSRGVFGNRHLLELSPPNGGGLFGLIEREPL
jgi:hypothetical protein